MARKPRVECPGALYHVIARGNNRQPIFVTQKNYQYYLNLLAKVKDELPFVLYSFCLMPNHIHLLIKTKDAPLSRIMSKVQTSYAKYFNRSRKTVGHVFQGRYKAILCDSDIYLLELIRYIHLNPVRAGLAAMPQDYLWSSHKEYLSNSKAVVDKELILPMFGKNSLEAKRQLNQFVIEKLTEGRQEDLYRVADQRFLGDEEFVLDISLKFDGLKRKRLKLENKKVGLKSILGLVAKKYNVDERDILSQNQSRWISLARHLFIYIAKEEYNFSGKEIADLLGKDNSSISHAARKIRASLIVDMDLKSALESVLEQIFVVNY